MEICAFAGVCGRIDKSEKDSTQNFAETCAFAGVCGRIDKSEEDSTQKITEIHVCKL